jgi:hypothetical protein
MRDCSEYPESGCWILPGRQDKDGYTKVSDAGKWYQTHRYAYMRIVDPELSPDVILRHTCDNPPCWNPEHMLPGTHADNTLDKVTKERHHWGEKTPTSKLTEEDVREIRSRRASGETYQKLGESFGVSERTIRMVVHRVTWAHVD